MIVAVVAALFVWGLIGATAWLPIASAVFLSLHVLVVGMLVNEGSLSDTLSVFFMGLVAQVVGAFVAAYWLGRLVRRGGRVLARRLTGARSRTDRDLQ